MKSLTGVISFFGCLVLFQNCSSAIQFSSLVELSKNSFDGKGSDNGQGYDGKIRVVHHREDNFTCEGRPQPESILLRNAAGEWQLIQNLPQKCAAQDLVPVTGVQYDDVTKVASFQGKTFTPPLSYSVVLGENPNLPDLKLSDGVCEDINGKCSLSAALQQASFVTITSAITVNLPAGTLNLTDPLQLVTYANQPANGFTIHGAGPGLSILDGGNSTYHLSISGEGSSLLTIENMTFRNGRNTDASWGSAVVASRPYGPTLFKNCVFDSNIGSPAFSTGTSPLASNSLTFDGTQFLNNPNGGFEQTQGVAGLVFKGVTMSGNGGVALKALVVDIINSTFDHNNVGLKLNDCMMCQLRNSTIVNNRSTGLELNTTSAGFPFDFKISNSTIYQNGTAVSDANLKFSFKDPTNKIILNNSIVAQNGNAAANCAFTNFHQLVATNSIIDDATCQQTGSGNISFNPRLGPLANNGGPTNTLNLLLESPALDAGSNALCLPTDQRGFSRGSSQCDIGAVEKQ